MRVSFALVCAVLMLCGCGTDDQGTMLAPGTPASIVVSARTIVPLLSAGDTVTVAAVVRDASQQVVVAPAVTWSTNAPDVATVSGTGTTAVVTAVGDGTALITATSGSASGSVNISVHRVLVSVTVTNSAPLVAPGEKAQLTAVGRDVRGDVIPGLTGFTYSTNSPNKVIVSPTGLVTAILPGSPIELTATLTRDGFTRSSSTIMSVASPLTFDYASHLLGADERPTPVTSTGEGLAYFRLQSDRIQYQLTWSGLSGPAVNAHIHGPAEYDQAVGVLVDFAPANQTENWGVISGSISAADIRPLGGQPPISLDSLIALMRNNKAYVNVHTATNAGGEIRGQIVGPFR